MLVIIYLFVCTISAGDQRKSLFDKYDALVLAVLQGGVADLGGVQLVVLDEADKLFDLQQGRTDNSNSFGASAEGGEEAVEGVITIEYSYQPFTEYYSSYTI